MNEETRDALRSLLAMKDSAFNAYTELYHGTKYVKQFLYLYFILFSYSILFIYNSIYLYNFKNLYNIQM